MAFREEHKAKQREWAAANPDKIAAKRDRQRKNYKNSYREIKHPPVVYFLRSYLTGMVKIGTTIRLASRIDSFRTALPGRIEIIGILPGSHDVEAVIHARFAAQRFDREWFVETDALLEFIKETAWESHPDIGGLRLEPVTNGQKAQRP